MKKLFSIFLIGLFAFGNAQESKETANRFFYELTFKPKKDSTKIDKVITILDITDKNRSIYQDYTMIAQDSIIVATVKKMEKSGTFVDVMKMIRMPKFSYKINKMYPSMKEEYVDKISRNYFSYEEDLKFAWNIQEEKQRIGEYNTQKAITEFGGRIWTAWFSVDLPFQDGPYKFSGLPGLIVKIEDDEKNYSWVLQGNKKINDYQDTSEGEKMNSKFGMDMNVKKINKEKFEQAYANFKKDPFAEMRSYIKPEIMNKKMPGSELTVGELLKNQEKIAKDFFNANDNPIEKK